MNSLLLETRLGQLRIDYDNHSIDREIAFKEGALSLSGVDIEAFSSYETRQQNNQSTTISSFEKHLLDERHSYTRKDVKELASKYGLMKAYSEAFTITIFLRDSEETWFGISSKNDEKSYKFEILRGDMEVVDGASWTIRVQDSADRFVNALEYVCLAANAINNGNLSQFILKMKLLFPQ